MEKTPEKKAFVACLDIIEKGLNANEVTTKLLSWDVISDTEWSGINAKTTRHEGVTALISALQPKITTDPRKFWKFVEAVKSVAAYANLALKLESKAFL